MAASTTTTPEAPAPAKTKSYTVTADVVMLTVGRKANGLPEVQRVLHGVEIIADPSDERILDLLAIKAIVLSSSPAAQRGARVTVQMVSKGMQGEEALTPSAPIPAENPEAATLVSATNTD